VTTNSQRRAGRLSIASENPGQVVHTCRRASVLATHRAAFAAVTGSFHRSLEHVGTGGRRRTEASDMTAHIDRHQTAAAAAAAVCQ